VKGCIVIVVEHLPIILKQIFCTGERVRRGGEGSTALAVLSQA